MSEQNNSQITSLVYDVLDEKTRYHGQDLSFESSDWAREAISRQIKDLKIKTPRRKNIGDIHDETEGIFNDTLNSLISTANLPVCASVRKKVAKIINDIYVEAVKSDQDATNWENEAINQGFTDVDNDNYDEYGEPMRHNPHTGEWLSDRH